MHTLVLDWFSFSENSNPSIYTSSRIYQIKQNCWLWNIILEEKCHFCTSYSHEKFNISLSIKELKPRYPKVTSTQRYTEDTQLERIFLHFSITMRPSPFCIMTENNSWQTILEQMPAVSHLFYNSNSNSSVALYWFLFFCFCFFKKQAIWIGPHISQSVIHFKNKLKAGWSFWIQNFNLVGILHKDSLCFNFIASWTEWIYT